MWLQMNEQHNKTYHYFLNLLGLLLVCHRDSEHIIHIVIIIFLLFLFLFLLFLLLLLFSFFSFFFYHFNILIRHFFRATHSPLLVFPAIQTGVVVCGRYLLPCTIAFRLFLSLRLGSLFLTSLRELKHIRCRR